MVNNMARHNARPSPRSDGRVVDLHRQNQKMRIATWNVGSMIGRSIELSKVLLRRMVNVCCMQETKGGRLRYDISETDTSLFTMARLRNIMASESRWTMICRSASEVG